MTLTTEQLRARAKFWREKAVEVKWESVSIAQDMLLNAEAFDELANNREAPPVGYIDPDSLKEYRGQRAGGTWSAVQRTTSGLNMTTPIYTAPPAPESTNAADWGINMQTGTPILTYKTCCVIESEQAHYVLSLINSAATPAPAIPDIGSSVVNDAAWKLHDTLTKYGPLNGHQFNHLKSCLYEALKIVMTAPPAQAAPEKN